MNGPSVIGGNDAGERAGASSQESASAPLAHPDVDEQELGGKEAPSDAVISSPQIALELLRVARCPECDGSGSIQVQTGQREYVTREMAIDAGDRAMEGSLYRDEQWEEQQCQWCYQREVILSEQPNAKHGAPPVNPEPFSPASKAGDSAEGDGICMCITCQVYRANQAKAKTLVAPSDRVERVLTAFDFTPWLPPFHYDADGNMIIDAKERMIIDVRGWGFLTGKGGMRTGTALGLDKTEAAKIQDRLGEHVAKLLNLSSVRGPVDHPKDSGGKEP